ncbi:MAG: anhydro-N-acetylmuramic acid kinase [Ignavibacteria bacterium]|nr:anhydro-N-acetylmuramic acid kinase [Ignavibacteria bacterium]
MNGFFDLPKKKVRTVIGILSGTSVDAIDVVLTKIKGSGTDSKIDVLDFRSYPVDKDLKTKILEVSEKSSGFVDDVCRLNVTLGILYGRCVNKLLKSNKLTSAEIDLIGSHGQTIHHLPVIEKNFGSKSRSTLQIGDPSVIANITGITTVGDFRVADVAAGGSGAPLVPYLDYVLFRNAERDRLLINIGGISNITYLPKNVDQNSISAFDTGPGNMIIDYLMLKLFGKKFDRDGKISAQGIVNEVLFRFICEMDKFHKSKPPKSTGREFYGVNFSEKILSRGKGILKEDLIATVTDFTAYAIHYNSKRFKIDDVLVSGGGSKNSSIMKSLRKYFNEMNVLKLDLKGVNPENKEAVLFALLANELVSGNKTNLKSVTGANRNVYLGKICPA